MNMIPETLWADIEKVSFYEGEIPGYAVISLNQLEEILKKYFEEDGFY